MSGMSVASGRTTKTGATGDVLKQAQNINKSLSALGNCIKKLSTAEKAKLMSKRKNNNFVTEMTRASITAAGPSSNPNPSPFLLFSS